MNFTDQKRRLFSAQDAAGRWGGGTKDGKPMCALCNHVFQIDDGFRWAYANTPPKDEVSYGNFFTCDACDGPDVLERYRRACKVIHESIRNRDEGHWPVDVAAKMLKYESLLEKISGVSGQPFTETHEHLPAWIETILRTRPNSAFREGVTAAREIDTMRDDSRSTLIELYLRYMTDNERYCLEAQNFELYSRIERIVNAQS